MLLHDAKMLSIELKDDHAVMIGFAAESGQSVKLYLERVDRMRSFDFREGNTVLEVTKTSGVAPSRDVLCRLFDEEPTETPDYLRKIIAKIEAGELTLVHIIPSYGCELLALCSRADLYHEQ
jgi:hypothetical protein